MPFRPDAVPGGAQGPGEIDYRLARRALIAEHKRGRLARHEVCDAHPELRRAAREVGRPTDRVCPICEESRLVLVRYVFGPRMPAHGRCITADGELARLARRRDGTFTCYVVEVCTECHWNHLVRALVVNPLVGKASAAR